MSNTETSFEDKCQILGELWVGYKNDPQFSDFVDYNDLGLPLAYAVAANIIAPNDKVTGFVNETFDLLLQSLDIEDSGFSDLEELFGDGEE